MDRTESIVICDAGPIIHLDELNCLELLKFPRILIPEIVFTEISKYRSIHFDNFPELEIVPNPTISKETQASASLYNLHQGEIAAITLARSHQNSILLTDDNAARLYASTSGIKVHGTIGILLRAYKLNLKTKDEIIEITQNIKKLSTLHIKNQLIEETIQAIKKSVAR